VRTFGAVKGKIGRDLRIGSQSFFVADAGRADRVLKAKHEDGKKVSAAEFVAQNGIVPALARRVKRPRPAGRAPPRAGLLLARLEPRVPDLTVGSFTEECRLGSV